MSATRRSISSAAPTTYIASEELRHAVNVAVALERPLLVRGEPGTGKTLLAENVAARARAAAASAGTSSRRRRRKDGLYVYDTVAAPARLALRRRRRAATSRSYIKLGPLGEALAAPTRVVLLIDEIDKADIEFPNDLLHELDAMRFRIDETGEEIAAQGAAGRHHHVEQREGAARRVPAPLRLPLHRVPRPRADGRDRARAPPRHRPTACSTRRSRCSSGCARRRGCARGRRRAS